MALAGLLPWAPGRPGPPIWLVVVFFVALAVLHTWPLVTDLAHLSRLDTADARLNAWTISWIAHALVTDPLHLFDANIFYPERYTLAYSEPLLIPGLLGAPVLWSGGSPVLAYNIVLLVGLVATALGMYVLVLRFTNDPLAAILAGLLLAFNAHTLTRFPHLQAFHMQWLPLALWALDRLLVGGRTRDAWWLGLFVVLAALTSGHLAIFCIVALATTFVLRPDRWLHGTWWKLTRRLGAAALGASAIIAVLLWPYAVVDGGSPMQRSFEGLSAYSATPSQYLATGGRLHYALWSERFYVDGGDTLFPGLVCVALALVALVSRRTDRRHRLTLLGVAAVGCVLSFGPATPLYSWFYTLFPPVQAIRATSRFGYLFLFGLAGLAGLGLAALRSGWPGRRWANAVAVTCIALVTVESLRAPVGYVISPRVSPVYAFVETDPTVRALAEFPFYSTRRVGENAEYVYASTTHWQPLVNGYSGMTPRSYTEAERRVRSFPAAPAIRYLEELGVTHVVVHLGRYGETERNRLVRRLVSHPNLELLAEDPADNRLYRVR